MREKFYHIGNLLKAISYKLKARVGYIGIVSALIISAVVVLIMVAVGQISFLNRINISDTHLKKKSRALAEGCVDTALLKLASNASYAGNETITVASDTCKIVSVVSSSTGKIISAQGKFLGAVTDVKATVDTNTFSIVGWEEVRSF
ncbi:MAG: hypothetical protein HY434_01590 [Candidatus Liptonbacteria bacterium]|nr:hypothetical protein [Candidatus Liptonbacteria bacterium]